MSRQRVFTCDTIPATTHANQRGGAGEIYRRAMIESPIGGSLFNAMSVMTIPPGSSIGAHVHENNEEAYILIAGTAVYTSQEGEHTMRAGDIAICYSGERHGIANKSDADIIVAGIIVER